MSYCKKCGAYIPDGQDVCLACGFDEAAEKKQPKTASSSAYAYAPKSEDELRREEELRRRAEQRRREQQEMNRKWAESEQRRSAEWDSARKMNEDGYYRIHRNAPGSSADFSFNRSGASSGRVFSYLSYISFLCFLPSLLGIEDNFTRFHAKQGRKLFWTSLILSWIPGINGIVWLFQLALSIIGIRNVSNGVMEELPVVGRLGEK